MKFARHPREAAALMGYEVVEDSNEVEIDPVEKENSMTRKEILAAAEACVCGQREEDYGSPEDNFRTIAELWQAYELLLIPEQYALEVKVELTAKRNLNAVEDLLRDIVPANLIQKCTLLYNQHQAIAKLTYAQMAKYSHQQLREEVLLNG